MLLRYIRNLLAQAAEALVQYPLLVLDRASIHSEAKIMQEFHDWGCQELTAVDHIQAGSSVVALFARKKDLAKQLLFEFWPA
jgi:precorrin-6B methylase 2